jgi:hypothetical protein
MEKSSECPKCPYAVKYDCGYQRIESHYNDALEYFEEYTECTYENFDEEGCAIENLPFTDN